KRRRSRQAPFSDARHNHPANPEAEVRRLPACGSCQPCKRPVIGSEAARCGKWRKETTPHRQQCQRSEASETETRLVAAHGHSRVTTGPVRPRARAIPLLDIFPIEPRIKMAFLTRASGSAPPATGGRVLRKAGSPCSTICETTGGE